jgi:hypothetical protein
MNHISSHWERYLREGGGYERLRSNPGPIHTALSKIERWSYAASGLRGLGSFPEIERCMKDFLKQVHAEQEMPTAEIARYFGFLRSRAALFYCVNREEKRLAGSEVLRFEDYPWSENDAVLLDEPCWYYTHFVNHRPPFFHRFDGPIRHRLAVLN